MAETADRIERIAKELKAKSEDLSAEDLAYSKSLKVINPSDIEKPWKYEKWHASMTRLSRSNRRRSFKQSK